VNARRIAVIGAIALIVLAVAAGFRLLGSPGHQRRLALDRATVYDLNAIARAVADCAPSPQPLPATLPRFDADEYPVDKAVYTYRRIDAEHFELCATFLEATPEVADDPAFVGHEYEHHSGHICFRYDRSRANAPIPQSTAKVRG
jgi:hypothetical protein